MLSAFEEFKKNAEIDYEIKLKVSRNKKAYSGHAISNRYVFHKNTIILDGGLISLTNKTSLLRILGHELSHIKNKDKKYNTILHLIYDVFTSIFYINHLVNYRFLAFQIIKELRCDIEGCHTIAKLSNYEIKEAYDFSKKIRHKKLDKDMTEEDKKKLERKELRDGYLSYITREKLTLKYKKLTKEAIIEAMDMFYEILVGRDIFKQFRIDKKEELIEGLVREYVI